MKFREIVITDSLRRSFWAGVPDRPDERGCLPWTRCITKGKGYGMLRRYRAHRVSYILNVGPIPDGLMVMHTCDNRLCVNPMHLRLGTARDNIQDSIKKGRWPQREGKNMILHPEKGRGENNGMAKLTADQVLAIREGSGTYADIGRRYGISGNHARRIKERKRWAHI